MRYMFICQFFNWNPNFEVARVKKAIPSVQMNLENDNPMDLDRELFIVLQYAHDTCLHDIFSRGIEILML